MPKKYNCAICARPLTDPESIAYGIGPVCLKKRRGAHLRRRRYRDWPDRWIDTPFVEGVHLTRIEGVAYTNVPHILSEREAGFDFGPEARDDSRGELALNIIESWLRRLGYSGKRSTTPSGDNLYLHTYRLRRAFEEEVLSEATTGGLFIRADFLERWFAGHINPSRKQMRL